MHYWEKDGVKVSVTVQRNMDYGWVGYGVRSGSEMTEEVLGTLGIPKPGEKWKNLDRTVDGERVSRWEVGLESVIDGAMYKYARLVKVFIEGYE